MDIKNDIKTGVKLCADAATDVAQALVEKSRLKAKANRIKQVIKADTELRNQAYIELGRYFYEQLRDQADDECEALCVVVDKTSLRIDKASRRYVELMSDSKEVRLNGESAEKIKQMVSETAEELKEKAKETGKKAKDKATDLSDKAKTKAQNISIKAKETVFDIKDKAKDKVDDLKSFITPDEEDTCDIDEDFDIDEDIDESIDESIADAAEDDIHKILSQVDEAIAGAEQAISKAEKILAQAEDMVDSAEAQISADDSDDEMAEVLTLHKKVTTTETVTISTDDEDDEESPEEFEF